MINFIHLRNVIARVLCVNNYKLLCCEEKCFVLFFLESHRTLVEAEQEIENAKNISV